MTELRGTRACGKSNSSTAQPRKSSGINISLSKEFEHFVTQKVESGMYHSASEAIRDGLRLLKERDELHQSRLVELPKEIATSIDQAARAGCGLSMRQPQPGSKRAVGNAGPRGTRRARHERAAGQSPLSFRPG